MQVMTTIHHAIPATQLSATLFIFDRKDKMPTVAADLAKSAYIERQHYTLERGKVTMTEMIEAEYFVVGEKFFLKDGHDCAELLQDGKLLYEGEIVDMHTCAARAKKLRAKRVNGFDYWHVMRENHLVSIRDIRENYRDSLKS